MGTIVKYTLLGSVLGLLLGSLGWFSSVLLGAAEWGELHSLWPVLGLGVLSASVAAMATSLLAVSPFRPSKSSIKPKRQKRRQPLGRHPYRARITSALRWQALSKSLAQLLRGDRDQFVHRPVFQMVHPEDVSALDKAFAAAGATKKVQQVQCRFLVADQPVVPGSFVYVHVAIFARIDPAGDVSRFHCRFIDLTAVMMQKELELQTLREEVGSVTKRLRLFDQDLARLKLSYRELYQNAPVMYFSMDSAGKLVTFNDTLIRTLGYTRKDLTNKNYNVLLPTSPLPSNGTVPANRALQERELETRWRKKDGTLIDVWLHIVLVYDEAGAFVRSRGAALDFSEKNRLANELRFRGDELQGTNQRLRIINTELEGFTHVVSHDLKEPLRTLQAYSHILAEEHAAQLGPDGFQYVNHLIRASRRLGTMIDDLLNHSQAGRITQAPKVLNVNEILATVRQDLVDLIQRKEAIVLTEGSLPDVIGDSVRLPQLLTNLVANGLKYNQNPQPKVVVGAKPCVDDPARVTVYVRDNGIGIDPAFHAQIFSIFRRLHQAEEFEGTGAGLAICKKIVEAHGGSIWVESTPGAGATFSFTLPRPPIRKPVQQSSGAARKAEDVQPPSKPRKSVLASDSTGRTPPHIVLVEDQSDVGMIIQKLGKRDGLAITWFPTAEEALKYLQNRRIDLLLLDVNLPGMSGVELCRRIRVLDHLKDTPVAMFTPDQDPEKLQSLRDAGADYFVTKDLLCQPAQWQRKIQELLAQIHAP